ncbi:MAG: VCBS repeat-containing protein [Phycisphaerae bacterium]
MKSWLCKPEGLLAVAAAVTVALLGTFAGCRGNYSDYAGGGAGFLDTGRTLSFFTAVQVDPRSEDSAGPQFVVAEDLNNDGLLDLVSAWNQSQPVQIHLQGRTSSGGMSFETVTLAGNIPVVSVAGLAVADFDQDGAMDIAVLIKETLLCTATCLGTEPVDCNKVLNGVILMYMGPENPEEANQALAWRDQDVKSSYLAGAGSAYGPPEEGGFTNMAVGDMDGDGDLDIVVAWNPVCNDPPEVLLFTNDGPDSVQRGDWTVRAIPDPFQCNPVVKELDQCSPIKDVALGDIDRDGDLDIVVTFPRAASMNVRWYRNPLYVATDAVNIYYDHDGSWNVGTVGQVEPRAGFTRIGDADIVRLGDVDRDGILDVVVRSTGGRVIQWLKGPEYPTTPALLATPPDPPLTDPFRNIPWQVYTLAEFPDRVPEALALGDLNFDGQLEVIASAEGGLAWFDSQAAPSVYDQWIENLIVNDEAGGTPGGGLATTDPNVTPEEVAGATFINSILVVDLDGDGANDFIVTLDRSGLSGLTNDAIVWFRNTKRPAP